MTEKTIDSIEKLLDDERAAHAVTKEELRKARAIKARAELKRDMKKWVKLWSARLCVNKIAEENAALKAKIKELECARDELASKLADFENSLFLHDARAMRHLQDENIRLQSTLSVVFDLLHNAERCENEKREEVSRLEKELYKLTNKFCPICKALRSIAADIKVIRELW